MSKTSAPSGTPRYDGLADWYDAQIEAAPHRQEVLRQHVPRGRGLCLDVGCGTGRDLAVIAEAGWTPVGVELSADQVQLARGRSGHLVRGDAQRLPFRSKAFALVVSAWTSTDVDSFDLLVSEAARVLQTGGRMVFYGVHPCFNGPHVETTEDGSRIVHDTYRRAERHTSAPWWSPDGIRTRTGGMRHVPLADFLNAFSRAGFRIDTVAEPDQEPVPNAIVVVASLAL